MPRGERSQAAAVAAGAPPPLPKWIRTARSELPSCALPRSRTPWLPGGPELPFRCRYNLACGHLAGRVAWIGLASAATAAALLSRRARHAAACSHPGLAPHLACTDALPPSQASLVLFWLKYPEPAGGALALVFMGTQAAVFAIELLWRRRGLRDPSSSYAHWRELLVAVLRLNEGLLGSRCLASGQRSMRVLLLLVHTGCRPAARWRHAGRQAMPASAQYRGSSHMLPLPLHPLACPAVGEDVAADGGPWARRHRRARHAAARHAADQRQRLCGSPDDLDDSHAHQASGGSCRTQCVHHLAPCVPPAGCGTMGTSAAPAPPPGERRVLQWAAPHPPHCSCPAAAGRCRSTSSWRPASSLASPSAAQLLRCPAPQRSS